MTSIRLLQPLGQDIFCLGKKFLVFNLVSRNLKIKYRRSFLGFLWTLLSPLASAITYYFVFSIVMKMNIPHYLVFILSGVLPWSFFGQTVVEGMESIVGSLGLISKVPIPLNVFPYVGALTNLVTLGLSLPILIGAALLTHAPIGASLILLAYYFLALFLIAYGFSLVLAIVFVFFRDLRHLIGIVIQLWFYGTPVVYAESMVPQKYAFILYLNPVGQIFTGLHAVLVHGEWPSALSVSITAAWTVVSLTAAVLAQKRFGVGLVEQI